MGSIVAILVFGAIYSIVYVVKSLASSPGEDKQVFGESFPTVDILEPVQDDSVNELPIAVQPAPAKSPAQKRRDVDRSPQTHSPVAQEVEKKERLVKLGNKTEAKRAFLYSEIFNRKY